MSQNHKEPKTNTPKSYQATERLRQAILKGEIPPGEWLRQEDIAARFGISPTPVRESLRRLEAEGLVEHIPNHGVRVVSYTLDSAKEYYALRALLEPYVLQLVATRMTADDQRELRSLLEKAKEQLANNAILELTATNWEFHEWLLAHCGSRLVQDVMARIRRSFQLDTLLMMPERASVTLVEHEAIVEALENGNIEQAQLKMKAHIEHGRDTMMARLPTVGIGRE
ncbi:MAG TPA: GntR family transcriptional regulator [Anaerolineae bacterium]|nr:GntR family transcriptional regulator [Anaerolineae bacterium]